MNPFVHEALFYADAEAYLTGTVPFVRRALAGGQPVLVAVPGPNLDRILDALGRDADRVRFADMTVAGRNPGRIIPWVLHAFIAEHPGTRPHIIGEPVWVERTPEEYAAAAQHEALINAAFAGRDATILCPYDTGRLGLRALIEAERTHPVLVRDGYRRTSPGYAPMDIVAAHNRPLPPPDGPVVQRGFDDAAALADLRAFAAEQARRAGLPERRIADLQIALTELATNSLEHGGGRGVLRIWPTAAGLAGEVEDHGRPADPLAGRLPPPETSPRGRGLVIVNHLCDLVRVHTGTDANRIRILIDRCAAD